MHLQDTIRHLALFLRLLPHASVQAVLRWLAPWQVPPLPVGFLEWRLLRLAVGLVGLALHLGLLWQRQGQF